MRTEFDYLDQLESEAIHILREVAGQFERSALLFSGGKDSITLVRLAQKAFHPGKFPFPLLHIDTGHNFQEALDFRDKMAEELGEIAEKWFLEWALLVYRDLITSDAICQAYTEYKMYCEREQEAEMIE